MRRRPIDRADGPSGLDAPPPASASRLWSDHLGRWSTRSLQILILLTLVSVVIFALVQVKLVVIPVLIATILAAALSPVVMWLRRHGMKPIIATWITLIAALVIIGGIVTLIVFAVRGQWDSLATAAVSGFEDLRDYLSHLQLPIDTIDWDSVVASVQGFLTSSQFGSGAIAGVSAAAEVVTGALLVFVLLFFFLKDGDVIWNFFLRPFRGERLARGKRIGHTAVRTLGGYVRGTAIVALVDATGIGVGLAIIGVPLALPLAVIVFFTSFIPLVGATLAGVLAALVALFTNGIGAAVWVVIIVVAVNQLEGNFLQPVVMAQSLKLHPLVILVALTVGTILGGIVGAILSVPIAAVGWAVLKTWNPPQSPAGLGRGGPPTATSTPVA
ncbi:AI-2E family transporter [Amnibacterium flavum]|uniref:AI-2E family transporter n=1 Tax=Amnibacterium flavum TaxID=2173173 RepID=A0A2V1HQW0_9MICO|nr:AI-2E family transporter [Amnibacterium flavum]PVZ94731.1 AI-2E family transporter [Amnibacterium flavum]